MPSQTFARQPRTVHAPYSFLSSASAEPVTAALSVEATGLVLSVDSAAASGADSVALAASPSLVISVVSVVVVAVASAEASAGVWVEGASEVSLPVQSGTQGPGVDRLTRPSLPWVPPSQPPSKSPKPSAIRALM